jgi:hypothetical protein
LKGVNWFRNDGEESPAISVSDSTLDGAAVFGQFGTGTCTNVYDKSYTLLPSTCPVN